MKNPQNETLEERIKVLENQAKIEASLIQSLKAENAELLVQSCKTCQRSPRYALLKSTKRTADGKRWDNLYLQVKPQDGKTEYAPIAIELVKFNPKQKNLLLAIAKPCEIRRVTLVSDLDNRGSSASVITEGEAE